MFSLPDVQEPVPPTFVSLIRSKVPDNDFDPEEIDNLVVPLLKTQLAVHVFVDESNKLITTLPVAFDPFVSILMIPSDVLNIVPVVPDVKTTVLQK